MSSDTPVDVVLLHRPGQHPAARVIQAIRSQAGVQVHLHFHVGNKRASDLNRWFTIARARNEMRRYGNSPWVMFVDDDVLLDRDCIRSLLRAVRSDDRIAAAAADYSGDRNRVDRLGHVAMGATLFRRDVLDRLSFRATDRWCECYCAAFDLRAMGLEIVYDHLAIATHLKPKTDTDKPNARILAAFDRRDIRRFEHFFLRTLRACGNHETVTAVAYGVYPSELQRLRALENVEVHARPNNGAMVPVRRIADFADLTSRMNPNDCVAYWDVADVLFQGSLGPLWKLIRNRPDKILAVAEPKGYPHNAVIPAWSLSIEDPRHRRKAFELLRRNPFLNSGFAAGSVRSMHQYFRTASSMLTGPELLGTTDWGDQMALNIYCHSNPQRWSQISQRWNFCVHDRPSGEVFIQDGFVFSKRQAGIAAVHGNARSLRQFGIVMT